MADYLGQGQKGYKMNLNNLAVPNVKCFQNKGGGGGGGVPCQKDREKETWEPT